MVDLDGREPKPGEPGQRAELPDQARQAVAALAVAVAAEVDPGQDELAVSLADPAARLGEHGVGGAGSRGPTDERDDAEVAREAAAVLHLQERSHAVEPALGLHAGDGADVPGDRRRSLLARTGDDDHVVGERLERGSGEVGAAARDIHATVRAGRPGGSLAGLAHRLVRDAAGVDDGDLGATVSRLDVSVGEQSLPECLRVRVRDLAAEEGDREARHGRPNATAEPRDRPPSRRAAAARGAAGPGAPGCPRPGTRR